MRLFVGLRPPPAVRTTLLGCMGGVPEARWQTDAQLHLTLAFLGEVDRHAAEDLAAALSALRHPRLRLRSGSFGTFDRRGQVTALWIGLAPDAAIAALADKVARAARTIGLRPEARAFLPHVTLARFPARGVAPASLLRFLGERPPAFVWPVADFRLFESRLGHGGSHYAELARFPLGSEEALRVDIDDDAGR
ncbi:RNA 2',3'-cyclic phosphodiesterase [Thermaurantiacus sp.]